MRVSRIRDERTGVEDDVLPVGIFPRCLKFAQVPDGVWVVRGWQGIIRSKAGKMAEILVDLMTEKLIDMKIRLQN